MKKLFILLLFAAGAAFGVGAQSFVGNWELFSSFPAPTKVIETPEFVYTLAGNSLSVIDKSTGEIQALTTINRLNGNKVTGIWYDRQKKYLFVAYEDYNIDLLFDDGRTINVPDLRDAAITQTKTINDVDFSNGKAYVGFGGGMLVIDADHGAVVESNIWNRNVGYVGVTDHHVVVNTNGEGGLRYAPIDGAHHSWTENFKILTGGFAPASGMMRLGENLLFAGNAQNLVTFDFSGSEPVRAFAKTNTANRYAANSVTPTSKGVMIFGSDNTVVYVADDGSVVTTAANKAFASQKVADWKADGTKVWLADANGVGQYDVASGSYAVSKIKPDGTSGANTGNIQMTADGEIFLSTVEMGLYGTPYTLATGKAIYIDRYDPMTKSFYAVPTSKLGISMRSFLVNPLNSNQAIVGIRSVGIRVVDLTTGNFTECNRTNIPILPSGPSATGVAVDKDGNLWSVYNENPVWIMKALKGSWENEPDVSRWSYIKIDGLKPQHTTRILLDEAKGNIVVTGDGMAVVKMPAAGMPLSSETKFAVIDTDNDEDGASTGGPWIFEKPVIDKSGWIWAPHNQGVFVIKNSDLMFDSSFRPMRPKVPRNDGTNLADYLLSQVECYAVAVDANNQKWIGTVGSGLYRVTPNGDEILEHITSETSLLPSNTIMAILPSDTNNDVYVGTPAGFAVYHSETAPAAESYDDVYAYPNPVTPDFTGYITITGLMDNSLVKIADAAGNVMHETRSNGGMCVWNGCDANGRRVRSGVYFVYASQTEEGATNAAVTKIIVVN